MTERSYTFRDPAPLARVVILWLYIDLAANLMLGAMSLWAFAEISGVDPQAPKDTPLASDLPLGLAAIVFLISYVITGFLILKWIYRVNRNAHSFARGLEVSPPWSVGWYFVPIAFLWKPSRR